MKPKRIQLRRVKGWRMPPNTAKVDRSSKFGNPYRSPDAAFAVVLFRRYALRSKSYVAAVKRDLAGKNLACWCRPGAPCHADVLLEIANP